MSVLHPKKHKQGLGNREAVLNYVEPGLHLRNTAPLPRPCSFVTDRREQQGGENRSVGVIAFYFPGKHAPCDDLCQAPFLGNYWDLGRDALTLSAVMDCSKTVNDDRPSFIEKKFSNGEAAYQALKFWNHTDFVDQFRDATGAEAFTLKTAEHAPPQDLSFAHFGNKWKAMWEVLRRKFINELSERLLQTGDSFLLEHTSTFDRDLYWSDNMDGSGTNLLGAQLMLLRDSLRQQKSKTQPWTIFLVDEIDLKTGQVKGENWQWMVSDAAKEVGMVIDHLN